MNLRPRQGLTLALATALASTAPVPAAAGDSDEPMVQHCYTEALTLEEMEAGAVSVLDCYDVPDGTPMEVPASRGTVVFAIVYDITPATGSSTMISGPSCTGGFVNFGVGDPWDNIISSTELIACGNAKHYSGINKTGTFQAKTGAGVLHYLTGTMNNATSSIEYAP